jgi:hypothetical protein
MNTNQQSRYQFVLEPIESWPPLRRPAFIPPDLLTEEVDCRIKQMIEGYAERQERNEIPDLNREDS